MVGQLKEKPTSEAEKAFNAVEIKIAELNLKPGAKLAMICPEDWTPQMIGRFQEYADEMLKFRGYSFKIICFPAGTELYTVSSEGGFK